MTRDCDILIIGSGFGGAVLACRLAEAGRKVVVLERGRRWSPETYPRGPGDAWIWDPDSPETRNGWIDFRDFGDMKVAQGAAVGGGSLIYANISVEAEPWVFETGWPSNISHDILQPHYAEVGRMLNVQELPDNQLTERFKLMREAAGRIGEAHRFRKLPLAVSFSGDWQYDLDDPHSSQHSKSWTNAHGRAQGTCVHCGNCDIGCSFGAKNTLDLNYLAVAEDNGAEIRPLHIARSIQPLDGRGFRVHFERIEEGKLIAGSIDANAVVVACGSLGSTELLLRCRDEYRTLPDISQSLGRGWSSNGDFLTPAVYGDRRVSPTVGPTITCAIDFLDGSQDGHRFFVEDGGFPDMLANAIGAVAGRVGNATGGMLRTLVDDAGSSDPFDCVMPWFGQAVDASDGTLSLDRPWWKLFGRTRLTLDWDIADSEAVMDAMIAMHVRLSEESGGVPLVPPTWSIMKDLVTPHPLGGCRMANDPGDGVTDGHGRVFGYPGLYVSDGACIPRALGLNPSRTIAAVAELHAAEMIRSGAGA